MYKRQIQYISKRVFQITLLFSILVTGIFVFFAGDLGILIYNDPEPGVYIRILAPIIPLMYLDSVVDGMLKGLNEQLSYLSYNMIDSVIRVFLIFTLLPLCGLKGVIIVIFVSEILNSIPVSYTHLFPANGIFEGRRNRANFSVNLFLCARLTNTFSVDYNKNTFTAFAFAPRENSLDDIDCRRFLWNSKENTTPRRILPT